MNLFIKSYNIYLFFFFFIALKTPVLFGQTPLINIPSQSDLVQFDIPVEYNKVPNISFCRNLEGVTFIGKSYGLLIIDEDQIIVSYTDSPVKAGLAHENRIGYITENDFGYIEYDPYKGVNFNSRAAGIQNEALYFESGDIASKDEATFFVTNTAVFADYNDSIHFIDFHNLPCSIIDGGKHIYLHVQSKGIYRWDKNDFELILDSHNIPNSNIRSIVDRKNGFFVISENNVTFFKYTGNDLTITDLPNSMVKNQIKNGWFFDEETMLCLGDQNRLMAYDSTMEDLSGLYSIPSTKLISIFKDQFNDLWLVYDFNIIKSTYPANYVSLDLSSIISGTILTAEIKNEHLYVGTNEGLFCINNDENLWLAEKIPVNDADYIHHLTYSDNTLLGSGNKGLYSIVDSKITIIDKGNFGFIHLLNDTCFIVVKEHVLEIYCHKNGKWNPLGQELPMNQIIHAVSNDNKLYLLTQKNNLVQADESGFTETTIPCTPAFVQPKLFTYRNKIYVLCNNLPYSFDPVTKAFTEKEKLPLFEYIEKADYLTNINNYLWSAERKYDGSYAIRELNDEKFRVAFLKITDDDHFGQIISMKQSNEFIWIIGTRKIVRIKKDPDSGITNKTLRLQSVTDLNHHHIIENQKLNYKNNHVIFSLGNIRYKKDPYPYYRYKISHYQDEWSKWGNNKIIEFDNLRERNYTFTAQSLSHYGEVSESISFSFSIAPPIYRKWYAYTLYVLLAIVLGFLLYKWRLLNLKKVEYNVEEKIRLRMESVLAEKEKSDRLVEDLLPKATAEELKSSGRAKSKKFKLATVLFSDIQGFTRIAEEMNPEVLIDELDKFFFHFDSVVEKYNIEKIKTIGDAYMAAGGIPIKNSSNPVEVVLAGLEMQNYMRDLKKKKADIWDLRIGIHTGPVISGVVGHKKLSYDIWGDTVNTASRMESSGEGGKVNISGVTYSMVKDYFICEYRGKLPVKYKGNIDMYFVKGLRPELSVDLKYIPNRRFFVKLQILRLKDIEEMIFERLYNSENLNLDFHNKEHIIRLFNQTELLGRSENISEEDLLITQTAALMLYSGMMESYDNFENYSVDFAKEVLSAYSYSEKQINRVCNLILATKMPFKPQNLLEKIMIDAKMEYLGRTDYHIKINDLYAELKNTKKDISPEKFIRSQIQLQKEFRYYTIAAQRLRELSSEKQIGFLKNRKLFNS